MFRFLTTFFLTTVIRAKERKSVPQFMKIIREALQKDILLSAWLLETFSQKAVINEFLIDCLIPDMKRFVAGLIKTAMKLIYRFESEQIKNFAGLEDTNYKQINANQGLKGDPIHSPCECLKLYTYNQTPLNLPILIQVIN